MDCVKAQDFHPRKRPGMMRAPTSNGDAGSWNGAKIAITRY
jgi:hypothetical protein